MSKTHVKKHRNGTPSKIKLSVLRGKLIEVDQIFPCILQTREQYSSNLNFYSKFYLKKIVLPPFHEKTCTPKNPAISRVFAKERNKSYKSKNVA